MQLPGQGVWGDPKDPDEAVRVLRLAVEFGVNLIHTADAYGPAIAEPLTKKALHPYPDGLVIATKPGLTRQGRACGRRSGGQSTCASKPSSACVISVSTGSTCFSCIASTPRCLTSRRAGAPRLEPVPEEG
jgi:hypothetical protein